jgi:hypothetical protein
MEKPSRFSILLVLLTALASCNSWNGNPSQGTQTGVQIAVAIQKPQKDALTNIREVEVRASVTGASKIDKVELFYQGGASGVITLLPQQNLWKGELPSTLPSGRYTLKAKAYVGASTKESEEVSFTYDKDSPRVEFLSPEPGSLRKGVVTVRVQATDNVGVARVQLLDGGRLLGESTSGVNGVFTFDVDTTKLEDGARTWRAVASDRSGNFAEATLAVRVDNTAPVVRWFNPVNGAVVGGVVTLVAEATDGVDGSPPVTYKANGQVLADADANADGFQWDTQGYSGQVTLVAEARDGIGNVGSASVVVTVDQTVADRTPPQVEFLSPEPGSLRKGVVTVRVQATDNVGVARVQLLDGGRLLGESTSGVNGVFTFDVDTTKLEDGARTWRAVASDRSGNFAEATLAVRVDNTAPVVRWFNPVNGAVVGGVVTLVAEATDGVDGSPPVTYKANGQVLADADANADGFQWDTQGYSGQVTLVAEARDGIGNVGSASVVVTVDQTVADRTPPQVEFLSPEPGSLRKGVVTVRVQATDNVGVARVQLLDGGRLLGESTSGVNGVFTFDVDTTKLEDGARTWRAVASDRSGNFAEATLAVRVDNTAPVVRWFNPVNGAVVGGVVTLVAEATDGVDGSPPVTYKANGQVLADADANADGFQWDTQGYSGQVTLVAEARDGIGNVGSASVVVTVDQTVADRTPPQVEFLSPEPGSLRKGVVTVRVQATDNVGVARVQLLDGGRLLGESTSGVNGVFTFDVDTTKLEDGARTWRAVASDRSGNFAEATLAVRVDNTAPVVRWFNPVNGAVVGGVVTLVAEATDGVDGSPPVTYKANGQVLADADANADGFQWDTQGYSGQVTLVAEARDGIGNVGSASVVVTVDQTVADRTPPQVEFLSPEPGSLRKGVVTVRVQATDNVGVARVQLLDGGRLLGESTSGVNGVFTFDVDTTKLEDGARTWRAVASDRSGNFAEATLAVRVDNTAPVVRWFNPVNGAVVGGVVTLVAEATDGVDGSPPVTYKANGQVLADADANADGFQWDTQGYSGQVTLVAEARDGIGNVGSASVVVTVDQTVADRTPPQVEFLSPEPGSLRKGVVTVRVQATDNVGVARVQLLDGGRLLGESTSGVNGVFTFDVDTTKLEDGARTWRAVASDRSGNFAEATLAVRVDNTAPVVRWFNPANGAVVGLAPVVLQVGVVDANPSFDPVVFEVNGVPLPGSTWTPTADGFYTLTARAKDAVGNEGIASIQVTVDLLPPQVRWVAPSSRGLGPIQVQGRFSFRVEAVDQPLPVQRVFFLSDKDGRVSFLGEGTSTDGRYWDFTWDTTRFANGNVDLRAVAVGASGKQSVVPLSVTVDNPDLEKPTVAWLDPLDGQNVAGEVTLRLRALDNQSVSEVRVFAGGTLLGTLSGAPYELAWETTRLSDGPVVLKAIARDAAGNMSDPAEITVQVRNQGKPPALSLLLPEVGVPVGVQVTVRASVTKQGDAFTWQPINGHNLWVRVYDYRGNKVTEAPLLVNGAEPSDNADSVAEALLDLGSVPNDLYRFVVEGQVVVNGVLFRLYQERMVEVVTSSNLPPALVIYQPRNGTILSSNVFYLVGDVTDDSGEVHAVEVRLVEGTCRNPGQQNYLLRYEANPYGLFFMQVPLDGYPYIQDGSYCLRVVAIDSANQSLRNIQEFDVQVDRGMSPPTASISVSSDTVVVPGTVTWTVTFSSPATYTVLVRKNGRIVDSVVGTGSSRSLSRAFSDGDVGTWDLVVVFEAGGVQGMVQGGVVAVTTPTP